MRKIIDQKHAEQSVLVNGVRKTFGEFAEEADAKTLREGFLFAEEQGLPDNVQKVVDWCVNARGVGH